MLNHQRVSCNYLSRNRSYHPISIQLLTVYRYIYHIYRHGRVFSCVILIHPSVRYLPAIGSNYPALLAKHHASLESPAWLLTCERVTMVTGQVWSSHASGKCLGIWNMECANLRRWNDLERWLDFAFFVESAWNNCKPHRPTQYFSGG